MSPEDIAKREFSSTIRGFDKSEVREFLRRVAMEVEQAQASVQTAASGQVPDALQGAPSEDDRFEALGDRIAGLLRSAHESAASVKENAENEASATLEMAKAASEAMEAEATEHAENTRIEAVNTAAALRSAAEEEAETVRSQAQANSETAAEEAAQVRADADEYRAKAEADALELRDQSMRAGEIELADIRAEAEAEREAAQADRQQAMAELSDAREQVTELLQQARSQSDFIQHEADEIIRGRVRANVDQAERRLSVLRNSEVASRDRIAAAHRELEAAMTRLDADPVPELPADADQVVLEAAKERGEASQFGAISPPTEPVDPFATRDAGDDVVEGAVIEGSLAEPVAEMPADQGVADEPEIHEPTFAPSAEVPVEQASVDQVSADQVSAEMPVEQDSVVDEAHEASSQDVETQHPADGMDRIPVGVGADSDVGETGDNEDALARLVREAMQRAVDSARSNVD